MNGYLDALAGQQGEGIRERPAVAAARQAFGSFSNTIRDTRDLDDATAAKLKGIVDGLRQVVCVIFFMAGRKLGHFVVRG